MSYENYASAVAVLAAIGQTIFVLSYLTFPWWRSPLGRVLFAKALTVALLVDLAVVGWLYDWPGERGTFTIVYTLVAAAIWAQALIFIKISKDARRDAEQ